MSPNALASTLLKYATTTSLMVPGALVAEIGSDALQDALSRGWLRPNEDTGFLVLTDQQTQINEMRELAATPEGTPPPAAQEAASRPFAMRHSSRLRETLGLGGDASGSGGAPGSGQPQGQPVGEPQHPQTPTSQFNRPGQEYMVGEDVVVADEGKSYQAKVQSKNPDGTYRLSFGPNRPLKQDRMFRREEMQRITAPGQRDNTVQVQQ